MTRQSPAAGQVDAASAAAAALAVVGAVAFGVVFVSQEHPAYAWDWGRYFRYYRMFGGLEGDPASLLASLIASIASWDYNGSSLVALLPVYAVFGPSRAAYIGGILALYTVPVCWLAARLALVGDEVRRRSTVTAVTAGALLFWPLWAGALRGMPDVVGLLPLGLATLLVLRTGFMTRATIGEGALLGLLLWGAFLLRRWYAYSVVALVLVSLGFGLAAIIRLPRERRLAAAATAAVAFTVAAATAACCLALLQLPLVAKIVQTDYGEIYVAYQAPLGDQIRHLLARLGPLTVVLAGLGVLRAIVTRSVVVPFTSATALVAFLLFSRTQEAGVQHVLPIAFWAFPAIAAGATWPAAWPKVAARRRLAALSLAVFPLVMAVGFATVLVPGVRDRLASIAPVMPSTTTLPLRLAHPGAYADLLSELRTLTRDGERFAVVASSQSLSDSLLVALDGALEHARVPTSDVDLRDGLSLEPFAARYVVVTEQPALHLPPDTQRVISIPDERIVHGLRYGAAYRRVAGPYSLDEGVVAAVMERVRPLSEADRADIVADVAKAYPSWHLQADGHVR